jgi:hypothetical protein
LLSDREMRRAICLLMYGFAAMTNELEGGSQCLTLEATFAAQ